MAITLDDYIDTYLTGATLGTPILLGASSATPQVIHTKGVSATQLMWGFVSNKTSSQIKVSVLINGVQTDDLVISANARKNILGPDIYFTGYAGVTIQAYLSTGNSGDGSFYGRVKQYQAVETL